MCWIALAICFGIKLFGGNLFEIMCNDEIFIKVCEYADNHFWADMLISGAFCFVHLYFFTLAICQKLNFNKAELIIVICTAIIGTALKILCPYIVGLIFDLWQVIGMQMVFLRKNVRKYINIPIANVLLFVFQFISMIAKNIGFTVLGESVLEGAIYSIDVILMILLYYAYSNVIIRKEKKDG